MTRSEILKMTDNEIDKVINIQGTRFDRKRKFSNSTLNRMKGMYEKGMSISEISKKLSISPTMVKYHVCPEWRAHYNSTRCGRHTGVTNITKSDRIKWKREIVDTRKMREFAV